MLLCRHEEKRKLLIFYECGRSKESVEGKFEATFEESSVRGILLKIPLYSKVDSLPRVYVYFL